jgi:hypothetical protein
MGQFNSAIEFYLKRVKILLEVGKSADEILAYRNLGLAHEKLEERNKTVEFYQKCLNSALKARDSVNVDWARRRLPVLRKSCAWFFA